MTKKMELTKTVSKRMNWLDWMKTIGMYLIVYGHYTSYAHEFIYTFSVPLFFVISSFLFKKEENLRTFFKKNFYNLILPMLLMVILVQIRKNVPSILNGTFEVTKIPQICLGFLMGDQKVLGACWFIYTLFVIKVILQITPISKYLHIIISFIFSIACICLAKHEIYLQNAVVNVSLSYPFFIIGLTLKKHKESLNNGFGRKNEFAMFLFFILVTSICTYLNGNVWVYLNDYGKSFILYIIGGFCGTAIIYMLCKWLDNVRLSAVTTISNGSIVILGLHFMFIGYTKISPSLDFISALVLLLLFVPVIKLCERYCPIILGLYRIKK